MGWRASLGRPAARPRQSARVQATRGPVHQPGSDGGGWALALGPVGSLRQAWRHGAAAPPDVWRHPRTAPVCGPMRLSPSRRVGASPPPTTRAHTHHRDHHATGPHPQLHILFHLHLRLCLLSCPRPASTRRRQCPSRRHVPAMHQFPAPYAAAAAGDTACAPIRPLRVGSLLPAPGQPDNGYMPPPPMSGPDFAALASQDVNMAGFAARKFAHQQHLLRQYSSSALRPRGPAPLSFHSPVAVAAATVAPTPRPQKHHVRCADCGALITLEQLDTHSCTGGDPVASSLAVPPEQAAAPLRWPLPSPGLGGVSDNCPLLYASPRPSPSSSPIPPAQPAPRSRAQTVSTAGPSDHDAIFVARRARIEEQRRAAAKLAANATARDPEGEDEIVFGGPADVWKPPQRRETEPTLRLDRSGGALVRTQTAPTGRTCVVCRKPLEEGGHCPTCTRCSGCGEPLERGVRSKDPALAGIWHRACFTCSSPECQIALVQAPHCVFNGKPFCVRHYHQMVGTLCDVCGEGIEGPARSIASGSLYHPGCFTCSFPLCSQVRAVLSTASLSGVHSPLTPSLCL